MLLKLAYAMAMLGQMGGPATGTTPTANGVVVSELSAIEDGLRLTRYQHQPKIVPARGIYQWDCSIMVAWILDQTAPKARKALPGKPLARDFYDRIAKSRLDGRAQPWLRVVGPQAIQAGDVFAWRKAEIFKARNNTGHVGFVLGQPRQHPKYPSVWLMRVADATRELHEGDSRPVGGDGGFGTGTVAFLFDDHGEAAAYGWYGEPQDPETYVSTHIVFGRAIR
jgi:hypothetical protein